MQRNAATEGLPAHLPPVITKYIRLSNPTDQIRDKRKQHLAEINGELRRAIRALPKAQAVEVVSRLDGLISIAMLIAAVEDLKVSLLGQLNDQYGADIGPMVSGFEQEFETDLDGIIDQKRKLSQNDINRITQSVLSKCWSKATNKSSAEIPDDFKRKINSLVFLISASKVYRETDELQMANISEIVASKVMGLFKRDPHSLAAKIDKLSAEKIKQPYEGLVFGFELVQVTPEIAATWDEISSYLEGLYNRVYRAVDKKHKEGQNPAGAVKRLSDGTYPTVDPSDVLFKRHKKVTKLEMSEANLMLAQKINSKTAAYLHSPAVNPAEQAAVGGVSNVNGEVKIETKNKSDGKHLFLSLPEAVYDENKTQLMAAIGYGLDPSGHENRISAALVTPQGGYDRGKADIELKLIQLRSQLEKYKDGQPLTPIREDMLLFAFKCLRARFDAYLHGGSFVHTVCDRAHAGLLAAYINKIDSTASYLEKIDYLMGMRNALIKRKSTDLLPKLNDGLLEIYYVSSLQFPKIDVLEAGSAISKSKGTVTLDIRFNDKDVSEERIKLVIDAVNQYFQMTGNAKLSGELFSHLLQQKQHVDASVKVAILGACLNVLKLNDEQKRTLALIPDRISAAIGAYNCTKRYGLWEKEHAKSANDFIEDIVGKDLTVEQQLSRLLDFRNALLAQNSKELLSSIDKVLGMVFDVLLVPAQQVDVRLAAAAR